MFNKKIFIIFILLKFISIETLCKEIKISIREIGVEEARSEDEKPYQFYIIDSIDCDKYGNIYVLDSKEPCVKVFDKDGMFIRKLFREGKGPNEIANPYKVAINKFTGNLFVLHEHGYYLKEFDSSGNYVKHYPLPEQIMYYFEFIDKDRILYIFHGRPRGKTYNNFKILNLKTLKIEKEFFQTDREFVINGIMRFVVKDGILWTCPGDEMRLICFDLKTGKKLNSIPIEENYKKYKIRRGPNWVSATLYNFAQPISINEKIFILLTKIEYYKEETSEDFRNPKAHKLSLYYLDNDHLNKIRELPEGNFMYLGTVWENRIILYRHEPFPKIRILELKNMQLKRGKN